MSVASVRSTGYVDRIRKDKAVSCPVYMKGWKRILDESYKEVECITKLVNDDEETALTKDEILKMGKICNNVFAAIIPHSFLFLLEYVVPKGTRLCRTHISNTLESFKHEGMEDILFIQGSKITLPRDVPSHPIWKYILSFLASEDALSDDFVVVNRYNLERKEISLEMLIIKRDDEYLECARRFQRQKEMWNLEIVNNPSCFWCHPNWLGATAHALRLRYIDNGKKCHLPKDMRHIVTAPLDKDKPDDYKECINAMRYVLEGKPIHVYREITERLWEKSNGELQEFYALLWGIQKNLFKAYTLHSTDTDTLHVEVDKILNLYVIREEYGEPVTLAQCIQKIVME